MTSSDAPPAVAPARRVRRGLRALLAGLATFGVAGAARVDPAAIDAVFREWDRPDGPGAAVAVFDQGAIVHARGYGQRSLDPRAPITPDTAFYVGSVSKQFTAAAIALLARRGVLSLDDDVRRHVPELPDYGTPITLRHCVHHTSGLRDYLALRELAGEPVNATFGNADVLRLLGRQQGLNFAPGTRYLYSNSGYFLLSLVVERVAGRSLREFAAENFFRPLGMTATQFRDDHTRAIPQRADGYSRDDPGWRVNNPNFDVVGAGGVFMTVRDFLAWDENFHRAGVGGPEFVALLQTPGRLSDGRALTYAFGLVVGRYRGLEIVEHSGAYGGFRAHVLRFPGEHFSVVCFANVAAIDPSRLTRAVADACLAGRFTAPAMAERTVSAPPEKAAGARARTALAAERVTGTYASPELGVEYRIVADAATGRLALHLPRGPARALVPVSENSCTAGGWRLDFAWGNEGRADSFTANSGRADGVRFERR